MKRRSAWVLLLLVVVGLGCSDQTGPSDALVDSTIDTSADSREPVVVLSEIFFGEDGYVAVTNHGEVDAVLDQWMLCQLASCFEIPNVVLDAGDTMVFAVDESGGIEGNIMDMRRAVGGFDQSAGEVALHSSRDVDNPTSMVSYVAWGVSGHDRSETAVEAGVWSAGVSVTTTESTAGIRKTTAEPRSADDWVPI